MPTSSEDGTLERKIKFKKHFKINQKYNMIGVRKNLLFGIFFIWFVLKPRQSLLLVPSSNTIVSIQVQVK